MDVALATKEWAQASRLRLWFTEQTTSTNDVAKSSNQNYDLYLTRHQSQGRGRGSNHWIDTSGGQLLSSWVFELPTSPQHLTSPLLGLALWQAAQTTWPELAWSLKHPNDLYLDGKKTAGLLAETVSFGARFRLIIGLGMNVTTAPPDLLANHLPPTAELHCQTQWRNFLNSWWSSLFLVRDQCQHSELSSADSQLLLTALNGYPHLEEKYVAIEKNGDLRTTRRCIQWQQT